MLILNLGVPRSGTILVFNIFREILVRQNVQFKQLNTNLADTDAFLKKFDYKQHVLLHSHSMRPEVQKALQKVKTFGFFNFRDPRDVLVSLMKLHEHDFEKTLDFTTRSFSYFLIAVKFRQRVMFIPYEQLIAAPDVYIFQLAHRLGIFLNFNTVHDIQVATSLEVHKKIMADVQSEQVEVRRVMGAGRPVIESTTHFINDRHVQSAKIGRWRDELSESQQAIANERFGKLLTMLGYPTS